VTNIAEHGLNFDKRRKITVAVLISLPDIGVFVEDSGRPFDPSKKRSKSPKRQFAKGADGGYGMYIFKRVFYEIDYMVKNGKNRLILYFNAKKVKVPP